eukprot:gene24067-29119_t
MAIAPDFSEWFIRQVTNFADDYGCEPERAFPAWALKFIHDTEADFAYNQTDTLSQGDAGLDGWYYDKEGAVFHLIQAKFLKDPIESTIQPGSIDSLIKVTQYLMNPDAISAGPHKDKLLDASIKLKEAIANGASVSLDVYLAGKITDQSKNIFESAVEAMGDEYSATIYDTQKFNDLKLSDDPISNLANEKVIFKLSRASSFYESSEENIPGVEKSAVATLDGRSVGDAVAKWNARLFHGNVRYYLRRTNRINKEMLNTLSTDEGKKSFWLFNNGLTVVADSFEFSNGNLEAINPQIVNGAQTSSVLQESRAKVAEGEVAVQCRVIAISDNAEGINALNRISSYTNSQSPVKISDLQSNSKRQKTLQSAFGMLPMPVFYERRRGEWKSLSSAVKAQFANRLVTKEQVGQHYLAYLGRPAESVAKKEEIFGDLEEVAFNTEISAQVYMLAHELFEQADYLLKKSSSEELIALVPGLAHKVGNAPVKVKAKISIHALSFQRQSCFGGTELYEGEVELFFSTSKGLPSHLNRAVRGNFFIWRFRFLSQR